MKKTLLITHEYYPFRGGIAAYCYNLFNQFSEEKYVVATDQSEIQPDSKVIKTTFLSPFLRPRWLAACITVARLIKQHQIQQIITPHILPLGRVAYTMHRLFRMPYVISLHGIDINLALDKKEKVTKRILENARAIITNSQATKDIVDSLHLKIPVEVITPYYGVLPLNAELQQTLRSRFEGKKVMLTVGRLVKRKGQDMVIQALPEILKRVPTAHYLIIGNGPDYEYLTQLIQEHHVTEQVTIIPEISDSELGAYYAIAYLFAMPARRIGADMEGFGIVYLEAASFGLPIVAGNSGGEAEAVGDGSAGLIVNGRSLEQIGESLVNLLEDEELAHYLGSNAKERLRHLPTWHEQAGRLEKILS